MPDGQQCLVQRRLNLCLGNLPNPVRQHIKILLIPFKCIRTCIALQRILKHPGRPNRQTFRVEQSTPNQILNGNPLHHRHVFHFMNHMARPPLIANPIY